MSVGGGRKYGVQVGNETYSLILTPEDWEKRRQDRENAKKLSLANNKRRKALDDRKRVAEARENRKRELELYKRRQRQIEATERYQRFHVGNKDKRSPATEQIVNPPNLEDVLQKLRGGYGDGVAKTTTVTNPTSSDQSTSIANQAENIATTSQARHPGLERTQWQNMKEYAEDVRRQILNTQHHDISAKSHKDQDDKMPDDNDGQDSLHGSSISTSSQPSYSAPNVITQQSIVDTTKDMKERKVSFQPTPPAWKETTVNNYSYQANRQTAQNPTVLQMQQNQIPLSGNPDSGILCKRDSQTGRITYYVKAYRPWSANVSNKSFQNTFGQSTTSSIPLRPSSSFELSRKSGTQTESIPKFTLRHQDKDPWIQNSVQSHTSQISVTDTEPIENISTQHQSSPPREDVQAVSTNQHTTEHMTPSQGYRVSSAPIRTTTVTRVTSYFDPKRKTTFSDHNSSTFSTTVNLPTEPATGAVNPVTSELSIKRPPSDFVVSPHGPISTPEESTSFIETNKKNENNSIQKKELKGILRRRSKYEGTSLTSFGLSRHPSYQSAGLARQKWLHGITTNEDNEKEPRVRSAEAKSVRWHQVQYNDGTSSMLDLHEGITPKPPPQSAPPVMKPQITPKPSPRGKGLKKPAATRPKSSPARGMKGAKVKGGRRLRPAKETQINIVPHPPPQNHTPQLSMSTVINYSIDPSENTVPVKEFKAPRVTSSMKRGTSPNGNKRVSLISRNKIVFPRKGKSETANTEAVTMSTLKSRGNDSRTNNVGEDGVISNHGNQVTIKVSSTKPIISVPSNARSSSDGRIPLNGTPTDQEIEMLWDKVRAYLAWSRNRGSSLLPAKKTRSTAERKIAWSTPPEPTKQISANIISIDGGIFSKQTGPEESGAQSLYKTQHIPVQYERYGIGKSRKLAYSPTPSQEYGFISSHGSQTQLKEKVRGTIPTMKMKHPSSAPVRRPSQMTDSIKTFRLVEALIEQNVPEEQILNALNSLQSTTREV